MKGKEGRRRTKHERKLGALLTDRLAGARLGRGYFAWRGTKEGEVCAGINLAASGEQLTRVLKDDGFTDVAVEMWQRPSPSHYHRGAEAHTVVPKPGASEGLLAGPGAARTNVV